MIRGTPATLLRFSAQRVTRSISALTILVILLLVPVLAYAQSNDVWLGGTGNWSDASKWSAGVPTAGSSVFIDDANGVASVVTVDVASAACGNLTVDSDDALIISSGMTLTVNGASIFNAGKINVGGTLSVVAGERVSLYGGGDVILVSPASLNGATGLQLTNFDNTISGTGSISGGMAFQNGRAAINVSRGTLVISAGGGTSNGGTIRVINSAVVRFTTTTVNNLFFVVGQGSTIAITGSFTNFSGSTLNGGFYKLTGGKLQFNGANIVTNGADIFLNGTSSAIVDENNNDGLRNFAATTRKGTLVLKNGKSITTPGAYSNDGRLTLSKGTTFTSSGPYTQTNGITKVDGILNGLSGVTIQAGRVFGVGVIQGVVTSGGSITPGASNNGGTLSVKGTYTQNSLGSLNIFINASTSGQLAVANGVSLAGRLTIKLVKTVPPIGSTYTILTGSAITGQFSPVNGLSINSNEHFEIAYNPSNVTLTVVSGP